jgi:pimeloyl-ACP methyl ester carboxylesterase
VFARCSADSACQAAFPHVASEFDSTLARLARGPATWQAKKTDGSSEELLVTDRMVRDLVQTMLGTRRGIEHLPMLIHAAYGGDFGPIAAGVLGAGPAPPPPAPRGVFFSILCSEAIPLVDPERVAAATAGTFFGSVPVESQIETCAQWPRAVLPASFWDVARAAVPVLAVSGDLDPITPPSYGELVTSTLPQGRHLVVPNRSHGDVDPCLAGIFEQFLIAGSWAALDTTCLSAPAPLRFSVESRSQ